jgi:hypothetical protein
MMRIALVVAIAIPLAGCPDHEYPPDVLLLPLTSPPPAHEGRIVNDDELGYHVELSHGVAIAARCWDWCEGQAGTQCVNTTLTSSVEGILEVRPVYRLGQNDVDEFALSGVSPGTTFLTVRTQCTQRVYEVTVFDD